MTSTKAIIITLTTCILTCAWGFVTMSSANDGYACLNWSISKYEAKASFKNLDFRGWRQFKANADYWESMCNE